jgi:hypothetical protein
MWLASSVFGHGNSQQPRLGPRQTHVVPVQFEIPSHSSVDQSPFAIISPFEIERASGHRRVVAALLWLDDHGNCAPCCPETSSMTANNHHHNTGTRHAKRKADSPEDEEPLPRPQRKKQKQQQQHGEETEASSPAMSPVAAKQGASGSALQKHLQGLYDAIVNAADNEYGASL